jgi:fatty acid desaturase
LVTTTQSNAQARVDRRSLLALFGEWLAIACLMVLATLLDAFWFYVLAGLAIATRQHALLVLFHDAVHGHLASQPRLNDALINVFAGVPALLPVEIYRPLHLLHHRTIGTADDPERLLLYADQPWNYRPLRGPALLRQLLGDSLLINGIRTIRAWMRAGKPAGIHYHTLVIAAVWIAAITAGFLSAPDATLRLLLLWFVPLLTATQLLQKLRSYAEHSGGPNVTPQWPHWTYSWRVGLAGRLTVWPYNINYHREHHDEPRLRWHALPGGDSSSTTRLDESQLWSLLHEVKEARK